MTLFLVGCTVGPDYKTPQTSVPESFHFSDPAVTTKRQDIVNWWTLFDDPTLNQLIEQASTGNLDAKIALARLDEFRAVLAVAGGERLPEVNLGAGAIRQGTGETTTVGKTTFNNYRIEAGISWELDLFGRIRRSVEAARADFQAEEENATDIMTSLYADLALTYFEHRTLQTRIQVLERNLDAQRQVLKLTQARVKHGLANNLEVAQAERLLAASRAELPLLRAALSRSSNALAVLLGKAPGELPDLVTAPLPNSPATPELGIPTDLLRRRPDIRRAERQLAAQTARVGIAEAQIYPNLSIAALVGQDALKLGDLLNASSNVWNLGVSLGQSLFNGSRLRNQVKAEDARAQQALLFYEKTVLSALEEVESAMAAYVERQRQVLALGEALDAARRTVDVSNSLYKEGLVDFENVLDAQTQQLALEDSLAAARGETIAGLIRLYRALGGGWNPDTRIASTR
ncbi:MAG: efflux transporter outer membrane subunit [Acidobacteriota bacterium]|nr:efflux transporter outer membrane subunit [Acidobacteriota bacterium]